MASSHNTKLNHLSPLNTQWHKRSMSDISATSDTATFHSAHAHLTNLELRPLSQPQTQHTPQPRSSPKLESIKMSRQDSGYSETPLPINHKSPPSSRRTSIASSSTTTQTPSHTTKTKRRSTTSRPATKRSSRSSAQIRTSNPGPRPTISTRHTTPFPSSTQHQHQFFHFPVLPNQDSPPPSSQPATQQPCIQQPPPATIQYWTSDQTRRLEYAAIDAASKGFRGLMMKLVPDCILPEGSRRQRLHCRDGEDGEGSDCGSVRRYRLVLPEEEKEGFGESVRERESSGRGRTGKGGLLRRWTERL